MTRVPQHPCTPPTERIAGSWTCPTCGEHWLQRRQEGWQRMLFSRPRHNPNLREAYELEQLAEAAPWWWRRSKATARRKARMLRRLEGQR